jgi:hypothetical protein
VHTERLAQLVTELQTRHPGFPPATVERLVERVAARYRDAPVQLYVPVLVRREADAQLRYAETIQPADLRSDRAGNLLQV